jgi:oligoribonuclease
MTGLDPDAERLIEIAVIVTGPHLTPRIEGPVLVIHQGDEQLNKHGCVEQGHTWQKRPDRQGQGIQL